MPSLIFWDVNVFYFLLGIMICSKMMIAKIHSDISLTQCFIGGTVEASCCQVVFLSVKACGSR